ncbi:hypothetical protein [Gloeothece verrucosa]|uniref:Uncharacterized protein n=1 Tax=Gloeothece verrucosa (strain PCC 7822) TaxID=497965 RepID=E0UMA3_GLOV7|nr:hypothetical protein [Gloeothece verrucosa]ADN18083.1 hypothetical protein Cyan7822_6283 [Gloeothece verrucosa PCC 7822]
MNRVFLLLLLLLFDASPLMAATLPSNTSTSSDTNPFSILFGNNTSVISQIQATLPTGISVVSGVLGLPNPSTYLSQILTLLESTQKQTTFSNNNTNGSFASNLENLDDSQDSLIYDIVYDGNIIYNVDENGNYTETVVPPYSLENSYFRNGISEIASNSGLELGVSETSQQKILDELIKASNNENSSNAASNQSGNLADESNQVSSNIELLANSVDGLATDSIALADQSQLTDTSFQILRNISGQIALEAGQNSQISQQFHQIGQILAKQTEQNRENSKQMVAQQQVATQLLQTSKQEQILQALQTTTQAQQLKSSTEQNTRENREKQAALNTASSVSGILMIPGTQQ